MKIHFVDGTEKVFALATSVNARRRPSAVIDLGGTKVIDQIDVRTDLFTWTVIGVRMDVGASVFLDTAWIGKDIADVGDPYRLLFGGGVGLMVLFNNAILMRVDVAASPFEQVVPAFYTPVRYPF